MAQLRAACAESYAIRTAASMPSAACRANNALTTRRVGQTFPIRRGTSNGVVHRRRHAATVDALTAQNVKLVAANSELATRNSALTAENSRLAAQCGAAVVDTSVTSEASLQEGNARAHARAFSAYSEYPVCPANPERT